MICFETIKGFSAIEHVVKLIPLPGDTWGKSRQELSRKEISAGKGERKMSKTYVYNEKLKYARELRGWSQEELARRVSCLADDMGHRGVVLDISTISRWERGRNSPSPFYRQLLCSLFAMNAEELGLLLPDALPQANEETLSLQTFADPTSAFLPAGSLVQNIENNQYKQQPGESVFVLNEPTLPLICNGEGAQASGQDEVCQDYTHIQAPPGHSTADFLRVHRRKLLTLLLAGTMLGGAAVVIEQFQLRANSAVTPAPDGSRHWPDVIPDSHKRLARVRVIQWMLDVRGWNLHVDGIFWVYTENAVMLFQENAGLPVTTTVSSPTWERLIVVSSMADQELLYQGGEVKALQEMLNIYGATPKLVVDGSFGPLTEAATKHFQQTHRLPVTGKADLTTWCLLVGGYLK